MTADSPAEPELPRGIALAWGVTVNPQRGPKRELSIERIVEAAVAIADAEGLAAVSMSRVAQSLGYTTMSLYRYITGKDDLVLLMGEAASAVPIPDDGLERDWRTGLTAWFQAIRAAYREHPWLVDIPVSGAPVTPNSLAVVDWFLRETRSLPLTDGEKISALLLLTSYARATSAQERDLDAAAAAAASETGGAVAAGAGAGAFAALAELVTPERFPDLAPVFLGGGYLAESGPGDIGDDTAFGFERILDGIEHHVSRLAEGRPAPPPVVPGPTLALPRDKAVREAAKARREAEKALREAQKREREAIKRVLEKERDERRRTDEREARDAERAAREADREAERAARG
ncbi:TetR/AcrR family transcriptional regulator C-terminal domain-containing protein [Agromyces sp. MMS24-K17]|uniref:TetR/AcrR family transcriptional regulator n=1 Tax=Agromyces sp. MMS24-K17 TaxID=3372850 RepID=UPI0037546583